MVCTGARKGGVIVHEGEGDRNTSARHEEVWEQISWRRDCQKRKS